MKIYFPDITNYKCFVVRNDSTIRAYKQIPTNNSNVDFRDYYYNSNYLYTDGNQSFSNFSQLPVCLDKQIVSNDFYYRNDLPDILFIFTIFSIFAIYIPLCIFRRLFRRFI